ncbi:hypothetical protein D3248_08780 [Leucobacter zeae]|nr:hypothetical protein [Leucobacter zeae]
MVSPGALAADPLIAGAPIDPDLLCGVAGVQRVAELGPRNTRVVPIESLIGPDSRARVLREALECGAIVVLAGGGDASELRAALPAGIAVRVDGAGAIARGASDGSAVGAEAAHPAVYAVNVAVLLRHSLERDGTATLRALAGMSTRRVHRDALALLPPSAPVHRESALSRALLHPSLPVYAIVFVYSSLRVLPVALVREFHGSLLVLWAIDVVTAVPYTWGVLAMLFDPRGRIRLLAAATTLVTFVVPYVYFWVNGRGYPPYVPIVIAVLTASSVILEAGRYLQERRLRDRYRTASTVSAAPSFAVAR